MKNLCRDFLLLETVVATRDHPQVFGDGWRPRLTPLRTISLGGKKYEGKRYQEYKPGTTQLTRDLSSTASLRNDSAVWLTRASLVRMLKDVGFEEVLELLYGPDEPMWWKSEARVLLVATPVRAEFHSRVFQ
jgi:hypothetical protein